MNIQSNDNVSLANPCPDSKLGFGPVPTSPMVCVDNNIEIVRVFSSYQTLSKDRKLFVVDKVTEWCKYEEARLKAVEAVELNEL